MFQSGKAQPTVRVAPHPRETVRSGHTAPNPSERNAYEPGGPSPAPAIPPSHIQNGTNGQGNGTTRPDFDR